MTKLYTSSWLTMARTEANHDELGVQAVGISATNPRYWPVAGLCPRVEVLCPRPELLRYRNRQTSKVSDPKAFTRDYLARLDAIGVDQVLAEFNNISEQHSGKSLCLCCFEADPRDCHRTAFSYWWARRTGEVIEEWSAPIVGDQLTMEGVGA